MVSTIKSDEHGNYKVKLPAGTYGFVQDKSEVGRGVYLPGMKETTDVHPDSVFLEEINFSEIGYENYWSLDTYAPFEITNTDLNNVNITHYQISICYTCP